MAKKLTRQELKSIIRAQRKRIEELQHLAQIANNSLREERERSQAVARRCGAALNGLGLIAETVQSVRREVTGA